MNSVKRSVMAIVRWGWFGLLVLLAFGYLIAGLSDSNRESAWPIGSETSRKTAVNSRQSISESTPETVDVLSPKSSGSSSVSIDKSIERVESAWLASLSANGMDPAPEADWLTVCRRMSLALVGSGLSLEEIRELETFPIADRENVHLSKLLTDSRYHNYWAERFARFLVGTEEGEFILYRRRRFRIWLTETFADNWRYDRLVKKLITAKGLWTDRPEVNFLSATFDSNDGAPDPVRLAARTSRAFLGLRIDCLQCHDDFLGNVSLGDIDGSRPGEQTDFHQLAAFFTSAKLNGLQGIRDGEVDYEYQYLDADEAVAVEPAVPFLGELLPENGTPRQRLADWATHPQNKQAAIAAVSHIWALMFGRPTGDAVDNLPLDQPRSALLEMLAEDFVQHEFDIRRLIRVVAGSGPFRVDSRASFEITPQHENLAAVFPLTRLRPEQVAGAIVQASRVKRTDRESSLILQFQSFDGINKFVKRYGDIGEDEFDADSITITQRLLMMNGNLMKEFTKENPILNTTSHVNMFAKNDQAVVETIYLCALNRRPTTQEHAHFVSRLDEPSNRMQAIEDFLWTLLNSSELAWNH